MATNIELWMLFDNAYQLTLSIPVSTCYQFSVRPLAWLRYVAFTIYGAEGHISSLPGGNEVSYDPGTDILPGRYYYVSQGLGSCLVDPDMMDGRTSDAQAPDITGEREDFTTRLLARDGNCPMFGQIFTWAGHIIPHAKGSQYLRNLVSHRNGDFDPPLEDTNDTRNGILLSPPIQISLGRSRVAFLRTPNFAMNIGDVNLVIQPIAREYPDQFVVPMSLANERLTLQHFNVDDSIVERFAPHNSDARQSDSNEWPPPLIFDATYGCAALTTWGVPAFVEHAREHTKSAYYDDANNDNDDGDGKQPCQSKANNSPARNIETAKQTQVRTVDRLAQNTEGDQAGDVHDIILALWMRNTNLRQAHSIKVESGEKVRDWLGSVE